MKKIILFAKRLFCIMTSIVVLSTWTDIKIDVSAASSSFVKGIDVSEFQGTINWPSVAKSDVEFAIIRCGTTNITDYAYRDDYKFKTNYNGATSAGIKVGAYMYTSAVSKSEMKSNINSMLNTLNNRKFDLPIYLDVEQAPRQKNLGKSALTELLVYGCGLIEDAGYQAGVYANRDWFTNYVNPTTLRSAGYEIWLAQYPSGSYAVNPSEYDYSNDCTTWQYSSLGSISGISGNVDVNVRYTNNNTVRINYHTNGGTIGNDEYYAKDGKIYNSEDKVVGEKWEYGKGDSTGLFNASTFKLTKKGYTFTGWSTSKSGGKVFDQYDTSLTANDIYPDIATKSGTVVLYAQWKKNTVTINYNTNGGTISSDTYYSAENGDIYKTSTKKKISPKWEYGSGSEDGLYNASTFGLSKNGYTFLGWSTVKSGGKIYDQKDASLTANEIFPDITTKSGTVMMYAQWKENTVTINYNINDGKISIDSKYYVESNGNIYEKEDMTSYAPKWSYTYKPQYGLTDASTFKISREGYTFKGWSTSKSGGKIYDQSNNSLTAIDIFPDITTKSGAVTMYAQWELNLLTMNYNTNGGQISENDTYYAENNGNIYKKSDNTIFSVKWGYSYEAEKGLYNASTFNLSRPGYEFLGWSISETGGTIYSQSDNTIRAATLFPDIYTKSGKVMLYAQWKKNEMIGDVNADGEFNVADVVLLEKWLLGASDITLGDWQAADLYKDDRLDVFDLCLMKRELVEKT